MGKVCAQAGAVPHQDIRTGLATESPQVLHGHVLPSRRVVDNPRGRGSGVGQIPAPCRQDAHTVNYLGIGGKTSGGITPKRMRQDHHARVG